MRVRQTLKIVNWAAAGIVLAVLFIGKERDYAWIGVALLAALSLHFIIETGVLLRHGRYRRKLADSHEFKEHRPFSLKDLDAAMSGELVAGATVPVILGGTLSGQEKKAPLSGRKALAYRLVAEPLEGIGKVGGQVIVVDSWWGDMTVRDETGSASLGGPGIVDGSSLAERVFSLATLRSELPEIAPKVEDGLGIKEGKEAKSTRIALREISISAKDKVRIYGKAQRAGSALTITGNDILDDSGSLLVRAASRPASSRIQRRLSQTILFAGVSLGLVALLVVFASSTIASTMFAPGGPFDVTRTGPVSLDLDGRQLRVTIGDSHWDFDRGDATRGESLTTDAEPAKAARNAVIRIDEVNPSVVTIRNGDEGYPRWDGEAWVMEAGPGQAAAAASASPAGPATLRAGRLYIRNLTGSVVTIRVLRPDDTPVVDTTWEFTAYESADDPRGHYLNLSDKGPLTVAEDARVELITRKGSHRILPLSSVAKWGTTSWLMELVPEYLAGAGNLWVKNSGDLPVRIWLMGADGNALYGDSPWTFEPKEGAAENKGLRLTYNDKNIVMTGRETVKIERETLEKVYEGPLERLGTWKKGAWTIDLSKAHAQGR